MRAISWANRFLKIEFLDRIKPFSPGEKLTIFKIDSKAKMVDEKEDNEAQKGKTNDKERQKKFGVLVCYEGLFPKLSRQFRRMGADFLVCITNDAWFGRTRIPDWHAKALRLRAMENRVAIARCANTGVSCFFDPAGRMYKSTDIFTKAIVTGSISTATTPTFYTRYGDIIVYISYPVVFLLFFLALFIKKK
jgi:apolipoprotein N-acyltransferase